MTEAQLAAALGSSFRRIIDTKNGIQYIDDGEAEREAARRYEANRKAKAEAAAKLVRDFASLKPAEEVKFTIGDVVRIISKQLGIHESEMLGVYRDQRIVISRFLAFYIARHYGFRSFPAIGRVMHRDHSTVMHGCRQVEKNYSRHRAKVLKVLTELGIQERDTLPLTQSAAFNRAERDIDAGAE